MQPLNLYYFCAGVYIHAVNNTQDVRNLGIIIKSYPITGIYFTRCTLSICGFPFLAGFYSKDLILERGIILGISFYIFIFIILGILLTVIYRFRLIYYLYIKDLRIRNILGPENFKDCYIIFPIFILFLFSIMIGSIFNGIFIMLRYERVLRGVNKGLVIIIRVFLITAMCLNYLKRFL
jgi:NADH-ubiquinone oxidoreductase chain 5